jgi:hypothetical protein
MTEAGGGAAKDGEMQNHGQQNDGVTSGWWRVKILRTGLGPIFFLP